MCGIIAVLRRPSERQPPSADELVAGVARAEAALAHGAGDALAATSEAAAAVEEVDRLLHGVPGVRALLAEPGLAERLDADLAVVEGHLAEIEAAADAGTTVGGVAVEALNAALLRGKDATWAVRRDRLRTAGAVAALAGSDAGPAAIEAMASVQLALSALDRLEVRGRDSAGIALLVEGHGLDLDAADVRALLDERAADPLFTSTAVRTPDGHLNVVYKAAAEIGELGDNSRCLRDAIAGDALLRRALAAPTARAAVLGHTRWASVGIISEPNAHPLNSDEQGRPDAPYVTAALNGDVDNHAALRDRAALRVPVEVTTDAKVIPTLMSRRLEAGDDPATAFRTTVATFDGSVAIAASAAAAPRLLLLALRGSGQALYVGLAEDAFVVASEPYGLIEETVRYLRMDGEAASGADGMPGQVVVLDADLAGELAGIERIAYGGTPLPVAAGEVVTAEITTRDIDRGTAPHFLLKEVGEAPTSMRKTLRGKLSPDGRSVVLGDETLPPALRAALAGGRIRRVLVIGQGTAAVAGQAVAGFIGDVLDDRAVRVDALPATELSGFGLDDDMADTLVVAISQSGTTTDTNRTVDLVRSRGATVVAIVNRRGSDLTDKADGVLFTSDGRDVEMSVASTKAFYAQVAAGLLLAVALAQEVGRVDRTATAELLDGLRSLPEAMEQVLGRREAIARAAALAPPRRYWAVVGNGPNRVAAEEIRIKLSELCYKSIACDVTEDKKHIDLSSEPLIMVCAAGLSGPNADDVAKEVAIYRAHKAAPIVVCTDGEERFGAALAVIGVPAVHPRLAFVLSTMVGHLFGYEAALAIDASARPLREARAAVESSLSASGDDLLGRLAVELERPRARFTDGMRAGTYDGNLEASTAERVSSLLRYAGGLVPLDVYALEYGEVGTPGVVVDSLASALTKGIDELTRPIDAIKHQAKTVTVGISRSEDALLSAPLVTAVLAAGAGRDRLSYRALRTLAALGPAVDEVVGSTTYRLEGDLRTGRVNAVVVDRAGVATTIPTRTERSPALRGIKHRVATTREVTAAVGRSDGRQLVVVPETKDGATTGLVLLHVRFADRLAPGEARTALEGYQGRFSALVDAVTETEPWRDEVLGEVPVVELLTVPVHVLADRWRPDPGRTV